MTPAPGRVRVGTTDNRPEIKDRIPIKRAAAPGEPRAVVLSLGPDSEIGAPLPDLKPGDLLRVWVELEVTTDAPVASHPGLIGTAYTYSPIVEARLLLAADPIATNAAQGRAVQLAKPWRRSVSHRRHHEVIVFGAVDYVVPRGGPGWSGSSFLNVALSAAHPSAKSKDVLLVGENEKKPVVDIDVSGVRVMRVRPATRPLPKPLVTRRSLVTSIPVAKTPVIVFSRELDGLRKGEQMVVAAELFTDAASAGCDARITTRLFLADTPTALEPAGTAQLVGSWKGHISKPNGFNCLVGQGPQVTRKYGVIRVRKDTADPLFVSLLAISAAPFELNPITNKQLSVGKNSFLAVTRIPAELGG